MTTKNRENDGRAEATFGIIGDVHGRLDRLERVLETLSEHPLDAVLLVGDLASPEWEREHRGTATSESAFADEVAGLLGRVGRLDVPVAWVPGNHDLPGVDVGTNLDRRVGEIAGIRVYGLGGAGPARFGFPYEWGEDEIEALAVPEVDLLLSHTPPHGSGLDRVAHGRAVGSVAVERHCARARALVCGHIHEAAGIVEVGGCLCLNAGALGEPYGRAQVGRLRFEQHGVHAEHLDLVTGRRTAESLVEAP